MKETERKKVGTIRGLVEGRSLSRAPAYSISASADRYPQVHARLGITGGILDREDRNRLEIFEIYIRRRNSLQV